MRPRKLKICVVTLYNSMNCGSYWQARMLGEAIIKLGYDVYYLNQSDNHHSPQYYPELFRLLIKYFIRDGILYALKYQKSICEFRECQKWFQELPTEEFRIKDMESVVLGSDIIWNIDNPFLMKNYMRFWGGEFQLPVVSYAASVGNVKEEKFENEKYRELIGNIKHIGIRDYYTKKIIQKISDKNTCVTCDPTFLFSREQYERYAHYKTGNKGYILLYMFSNLNKKQGKQLVMFAKKRNLQIYCLIRRQRYMERFYPQVLINSPDRFLRYMLDADYVITDTFHGTMFSMNFQKQFVVLDYGKQQINTVLEDFGFQDRLVDNASNFIPKLKESIEYKCKETHLRNIKNNSWEFLKMALDDICSKEEQNREK